MTITIITYITVFLMGMVAGMFLKDHQHSTELETEKSSRRFWQSRAQDYQSQYNSLIDRTHKLNVLKFKANMI